MGLDIKKLQQQFVGDEDIMRAVIQNFLDHSPLMLENIQAAVTHQDAPSLYYAAHTLKGSVSNFFVYELLENLNKLEHMGKEKDLSSAQSLYMEVISQMKTLCQELDIIIAEKETT